MYRALSPEALGIRGHPLPEMVALAAATRFAGLAFDIREADRLASTHGEEYVSSLFAEAGVRPAHWGLPVAWRDERQWVADLRELPNLAALARRLGCPRTTTYMPAGSNERPYAENLAWHVARFRSIAEVLRDEGCVIGIEFIGPATYRAQFQHEFISTLAGVMELIDAIGTGNVGLLLDAWHLYTSHGTLADLDRLTAKDIVVVHINDAPAGIAVDEQIDTVRALPMETGVINGPGFMRKLRELGYDGPVTPEPFSQRVGDLAATDPASAAQEAARAMDALWRAAGLESPPERT